jgi:RimJ/RimL family protein N-acetyltransferase
MSEGDLRSLALRGGHHALIGSATEHDAAELVQYLELIAGETDFITFGRGELGITIEQEAAFVRGLQSGGGLMLKAVVDGEIAGVGSLMAERRPRLRHNATLGLSVQRKYWGMGVGRALCEELIIGAQALAVTRIELRVRHDNARAISLYETLGFQLRGTLPGAFIANGIEYDDLLMDLRLHHDPPRT